eukprot:574607-Prorocentrum_minimum.AAC.1
MANTVGNTASTTRVRRKYGTNTIHTVTCEYGKNTWNCTVHGKVLIRLIGQPCNKRTTFGHLPLLVDRTAPSDPRRCYGATRSTYGTCARLTRRPATRASIPSAGGGRRATARGRRTTASWTPGTRC